MRAVMSDVPPEILAWRRKTGADRRDEVWDGVLHMVPNPINEHQRLKGELFFWLQTHWVLRTAGHVLIQVNVSRGDDWREDYRVPDLVLLLPGGRATDREKYFEGGPDVVVEIKSPGDESYEKLPFYAELGVREVWVVDRDTKTVEVHSLHEGAYSLARADDEGWITSPVSGLALRGREGAVDMRWAEAR